MNNFILSFRFFVVSRFKLSSSISRFTSRSLFDPSKKTQTLDQNFSEGRKEEGKSRNRGGGYLNRSVQRQLFPPPLSFEGGTGSRREIEEARKKKPWCKPWCLPETFFTRIYTPLPQYNQAKFARFFTILNELRSTYRRNCLFHRSSCIQWRQMKGL